MTGDDLTGLFSQANLQEKYPYQASNTLHQ